MPRPMEGDATSPREPLSHRLGGIEPDAAQRVSRTGGVGETLPGWALGRGCSEGFSRPCWVRQNCRQEDKSGWVPSRCDNSWAVLGCEVEQGRLACG